MPELPRFEPSRLSCLYAANLRRTMITVLERRLNGPEPPREDLRKLLEGMCATLRKSRRAPSKRMYHVAKMHGTFLCRWCGEVAVATVNLTGACQKHEYMLRFRRKYKTTKGSDLSIARAYKGITEDLHDRIHPTKLTRKPKRTL